MESAAQPEAAVAAEIEWRRVIGAFQLSIPVKDSEALVLREERDLSVLRWIAQAIPDKSRWYEVFQRYLNLIGGRVSSFGGDPGTIEPSPTGDGVPTHKPHRKKAGEHRFTGKIADLIFDRFGDFIGFVLETETGERRVFSREPEIERLAERAWRDRLRISVIVVEHDRLERVMIHKPPRPFAH